MQPNQIFINFISSLCGFVKISDNSVLNLTNNQIITSYTEVQWLKIEESFKSIMILEAGRDKFQIHYKCLVDTYISQHCHICHTTQNKDLHLEYLEQKSRLEEAFKSFEA